MPNIRKARKLWEEAFEVSRYDRLLPYHILSGDILSHWTRIEKILHESKSPMSLVKVDARPLPKGVKASLKVWYSILCTLSFHSLSNIIIVFSYSMSTYVFTGIQR